MANLLPVFWLDASQEDAPDDGQALSAVPDRGPYGQHAATFGGGWTYSADGGPGGLPCYSLDGSSYAGVSYPRRPSAGAPGLIVAAVIKLSSLSSWPEICQIGKDHATAYSAWQFAVSSSGAIYSACYGGEGNERYSPDGTVGTAWEIVCWQVSGGAPVGATNPTFWTGSGGKPSTQGGGSQMPSLVMNHIRVGANLVGSPSQMVSGRIAELVVLAGDADADRSALISALKSKYGL